MRNGKRGKRYLSGLLALLLWLSMPGGALAAEGESSLPPEEPVSAAAGEGLSSEAPSLPEEESAGEDVLDENRAQAFSALPLLVTGGHSTYLNGYPGGYFYPNQAMSRKQAAQMLYNLLAAIPPVSGSQFSDVPVKQWYSTPVNALAKAGVLSGYKDGTFLPDREITRAEFVTILCRCFSLAEGSASFADVQDHWAYASIAAATSAGWINGVNETSFQPNRGIKRGEAVKVMNIALGRTGEGFAADRGVQKFKDVSADHWAYLHITEAASPVEEPDPVPSDFEVGQKVRVTASGGLNLREAPVDGRVITVLSGGAILTVTDISQSGWLGVETSDGQKGYVSAEYVQIYIPGQASGARLSASTLSFHQYQTVRLDASVSSGLDSMRWTSSDPSVAVVGYTLDYILDPDEPPTEQGAMVYGKKPGTATLTFADEAGKTSASCTVTVTAPEGVRFGYASENTLVKGREFDLIAITEDTRTSVTFKVTGPASGTYTATDYMAEKRSSGHGLPDSSVRVFRKAVTLHSAGTYTVQATANGYPDVCTFQVFVRDSAESATAVSAGERRASNQMLRLIANYEGAIPECYDDRLAPKHPTVGYGYVVPVNGAFYNTLTATELWAMLVDKVNNDGYSSGVNSFRSRYGLSMSQAQFDALVSFAYNMGPGYFTPDYGFCRAMLNAAAVTAPASGTVTVTDVDAGGAILYDKAGLDGKLVEKVKKGESVSITAVQRIADRQHQEVWYQVQHGSKSGWMPAGYVTVSGASTDLSWVDSTVLANNLLQWCHAGGVQPGLVWRRLGECKVFFFGDYAGGGPTSSSYHVNTYGFHFPDEIADYDRS